MESATGAGCFGSGDGVGSTVGMKIVRFRVLQSGFQAMPRASNASCHVCSCPLEMTTKKKTRKLQSINGDDELAMIKKM